MGEPAQGARPLGHLINAPGGYDAHRHQRQGQSDAETGHQGKSEREPLQLEANQENAQRRGTGHEPARQTEQHDLAGCNFAAGKAPLNLLSVLAGVGVVLLFTVTKTFSSTIPLFRTAWKWASER